MKPQNRLLPLHFSILTSLALSLGATHVHSATILDVNFGSANDELGGFTTSQTGGSWTETANSQRYNATNTNWTYAGLFTELSGGNALSTTAGSSYTFTTVIDSISNGDGVPQNRFGMLLFATSTTRGIFVGLQGSNLSVEPGGLELDGLPNSKSWGGNGIGTDTFTFESTVSFTATDANVSFTLTDTNAFSDTLTASIALADITGGLGESFGVGSRTRQRNNASSVTEYGVQSFSIIPEPSTALLGALGLLALLRRRR